jgi:hypothetical protein
MAANMWVKTGTGWKQAKGVFRYNVSLGWVQPNGIYVQKGPIHPVSPNPVWERIAGSDFTRPEVAPGTPALAAGHTFRATASWTNTSLAYSVNVMFEVMGSPPVDWHQRFLLSNGASSCTAEFTPEMFEAGYRRVRARVWYSDEGGEGPYSALSNEVLLGP